MHEPIDEIINERIHKNNNDNEHAVENIGGRSIEELLDGIRDKIQRKLQKQAKRPGMNTRDK